MQLSTQGGQVASGYLTGLELHHYLLGIWVRGSEVYTAQVPRISSFNRGPEGIMEGRKTHGTQ